MSSLQQILEEVLKIKREFIQFRAENVLDGFISKNSLMKALDYSKASINRLEKKGLTHYKLGDRKFYKVKDVIALFEEK